MEAVILYPVCLMMEVVTLYQAQYRYFLLFFNLVKYYHIFLFSSSENLKNVENCSIKRSKNKVIFNKFFNVQNNSNDS